MKWSNLICFGFVCSALAVAPESIDETPIDFYREAQNENLNAEELKFMQPFLENLQLQYDHITSKSMEVQDSTQDEDNKHLNQLIYDMLDNFSYNDDDFNESFTFDTHMPTAGELKKILAEKMPSEEALDLENILSEEIDEAQLIVKDLVDQSNQIAADLIKINKIKILTFIYKMLGKIFTQAVGGARTAYCTYYHIPVLNSTLTEGRTNIRSCYVYTTTSIASLRKDIQNCIDTIRTNVAELVSIYKKIANRQSLLGKLLSLLLNVSKVRNDITESRATGLDTIKKVKTEAPTIIRTTQECATTYVPSFVKQLNETVTGLLTCINFVDDSTPGPEPEPESSEEISQELLEIFGSEE